MFAALFCLLEWLRGHVLTGLSVEPGRGQLEGGIGGVAARARSVGVYGLSVVTVARCGRLRRRCSAPDRAGAGSDRGRLGALVA